MVMTLAKITAGTGYTYLTRHTARGDAGQGNDRDAASYYTAQGNPPGRWTGRGAPLLGLAGREVTEDQMRALFGVGAPPDMDAMIDAYMDAHWRPWMTGDRLHKLAEDAVRHATLGRQFPEYKQLKPFSQRVETRLDLIRQETRREPAEAEIRKVKAEEAHRQRAAVAGFDLVFSPVKSAALLWALDERPWVRDAIRAAHEEAKNAALDLLEDHAALTRTGTNGVAQIATKGLIAAEIEHWDSRAGDPNLHTHVAISSKVLGVDGTWHALDARPLYRMIVAASETYNTAFEAALTARLAVTFTARPDTRGGREPVREITGVPFAMIEFFSRRRAAIEGRYAQLVRGYRDEHGHDPSADTARQLAQQANLDTRQGKKPPRPLADKRAAWREELTTRFGPSAVAQLMRAVPSNPPAQVPEGLPVPVDVKDLAERTVAAVSARRSTWTVWNLHAEAERLLRSEVPVLAPERHRDLVAQVTALAISPARSISVEAPAILSEPAELRRSDGEPVFTEHAAGRFTSQPVLDAETRLVNATRTPTAAGLSGVSVAAALDGFEARTGTTLDPGQRNLVTSFASDSRLLLAGIGPAGSGKTTAMRALAHVLRQGGRNLTPLATSAAAADVLGRELSVRAENLHKFLHEWTRGPFAAKLRAGAGVPGQARMFRLGADDVVLVDEAGMADTFLLDELRPGQERRRLAGRTPLRQRNAHGPAPLPRCPRNPPSRLRPLSRPAFNGANKVQVDLFDIQVPEDMAVASKLEPSARHRLMTVLSGYEDEPLEAIREQALGRASAIASELYRSAPQPREDRQIFGTNVRGDWTTADLVAPSNLRFFLGVLDRPLDRRRAGGPRRAQARSDNRDRDPIQIAMTQRLVVVVARDAAEEPDWSEVTRRVEQPDQ